MNSCCVSDFYTYIMYSSSDCIAYLYVYPLLKKKNLTGPGIMFGRIIVPSQAHGKEQKGEKSFPSVAVMTIKLLLIHL